MCVVHAFEHCGAVFGHRDAVVLALQAHFSFVGKELAAGPERMAVVAVQRWRAAAAFEGAARSGHRKQLLRCGGVIQQRWRTYGGILRRGRLALRVGGPGRPWAKPLRLN